MLSEEERNRYSGIVKWYDGTIHYFKNGKLHRLDGPAYIGKGGYKQYFFEGKLHNLQGPAIIYQNGQESYWINDIFYPKTEWKKHPEVIRNSKEFKDLLDYKNTK